MRTMISAFDHAPLWRVEFIDGDGCLVETRLVDREARDEILRDWNLHSPMPSACAFRFVSLNQNLERDDE
jgi:hypothetical protein